MTARIHVEVRWVGLERLDVRGRSCGSCSFADQPSLYVCGASKRLRLVMEVQASRGWTERTLRVSVLSTEPFASDNRKWSLEITVAKGPWKSDDQWPPAR